jgi:hypothetical protein
VDFVVWFQLSPFSFPGIRQKKVKRYEHDVQLNTALQHEVVHYTTTGIKLSAKRFATGEALPRESGWQSGSGGMQLPGGWLEKAAEMACGDARMSESDTGSPPGECLDDLVDQGAEMDRFGSGRSQEKRTRTRKEKDAAGAASRGSNRRGEEEGGGKQASGRASGTADGVSEHVSENVSENVSEDASEDDGDVADSRHVRVDSGGVRRHSKGSGGDSGSEEERKAKAAGTPGPPVPPGSNTFSSNSSSTFNRSNSRSEQFTSFLGSPYPEDALMLEPLQPKQTRKRFTSYCTATFGAIRHMFGVDVASYARSLSKTTKAR